MRSFLRLLKQLRSTFFPARASTQTWMMLTFALFVGFAVVTVGLYMALVLRGEIQVATHQTLYQQAVRLASLIEQAPDEAGQGLVVRDLARFTNLRITVVSGNTVVWDLRGSRLLSDGALLEYPEMKVVQDGHTRYETRIDTSGERMVYVAMKRPDSGLVVRIGQPEPPLFVLVRRMQVTLLVTLVMAVLAALLGSWLAAHQITRPLRAIRNSARSISQGRFDEKIEVDSRSAEFQDLAKNLNRMSDSFREKIIELQRLAQLQNEFIGNVSHEVRNPIFAVGGYLEALASPNLNNKQRQFYAEKGLANLNRLNNLFNDLIEIARLEYREDLIKREVFDLQDLLHEVAEMLRPKAEDKGLLLEVQNQSVEVLADRNRIRQVLVNLIDNAIAYSDEGTIRCRFQRRLDKVRIEVVDTGRGISDDHLERIFERFYRVDPDRSRKSGGTGLGLSIVKQILHAHGEYIHVESTLGRSTRFWFELPHTEEAEPA